MTKFADYIFGLSRDIDSMYPSTVTIIKSRPVMQKVEWQLGYDKFDEYPYSAFDMIWDPWISTGRCQEMDAWCSISFNGGDWHRAQQTYRFKNEQDRTLFLLRWSE